MCCKWLGMVALVWLGSGMQAWAQTPPIVIKFSHVTTVDTPKGRAAELFRMRAETLTRGRVKIEIYPNGKLFNDNNEFEGLAKGQVQMLAPSLPKFGTIGLTEFEVFDIPYIFPSRAVLQRIEEGPIGKGLLRKLETKGLVGLAYWDNGFMLMSANRPLVNPDDMRGLKVRVHNSKTAQAQMRMLGATPYVYAFNEAYEALQGGSLDGTENPPSNMYTQKMHEVQRYATDTYHGYIGYAVVISKPFWDGLPADIRGQLEQAMRDATRYAQSVAQQDNDDALAVIERSGKTKITRLTEAQRKAWRQALAPAQQEAAGRVGADLIRAINKEAASGGS